jgi:hypothetical protein
VSLTTAEKAETVFISQRGILFVALKMLFLEGFTTPRLGYMPGSV